MRYVSEKAGTLEVIGGAETAWRYGPGVYAKYDAPTIGNWEQSLVYRNENIVWNKVSVDQPDERRWALSYNSSYHNSERMDTHWGLLYQPYRLDYTYADPNDQLADGTYRVRSMREVDALGLTLRTEMKPTSAVDQVDLGYSYLGLAPPAISSRWMRMPGAHFVRTGRPLRLISIAVRWMARCLIRSEGTAAESRRGVVNAARPRRCVPRGLEQPRGPYSQPDDGV